MKKILKIIIMIFLLVILKSNISYGFSKDENSLDKVTIKRDILVIMLSYEDLIKDIEKGEEGTIYLVTKNGEKIIYDDNKVKSYDSKISNGDLQDSLEIIYPLESIDKVMDKNVDPGRIRSYPFLEAVYGNSREKIEKTLTYVPTYYGNILFNKLAAENLKITFDEIKNIINSNPKVGEYVTPISGTYNYRVIQDTGRLSPHSYAIAIDLHRNNADYWKWVNKEVGSSRIASYPKDLVKAFENNGFVWGGKWEHFDILHFEYRPEIILKSKYFGTIENEEFKNWHDGVPINEKTSKIIEFIDSKNL